MDFVVPSMIMLYVTVVFIVAVVVIADPVAVELIVPFALAVTVMLVVVLVVPVVVGAVVVVAVGLNIDDKVNSINGYVVVGVRHVPSDCCLEFGVVVVRLVAEVDTLLSVDDLTIPDLLHKKLDGSV